jgi:hypothetical protein
VRVGDDPERGAPLEDRTSTRERGPDWQSTSQAASLEKQSDFGTIEILILAVRSRSGLTLGIKI